MRSIILVVGCAGLLSLPAGAADQNSQKVSVDTIVNKLKSGKTAKTRGLTKTRGLRTRSLNTRSIGAKKPSKLKSIIYKTRGVNWRPNVIRKEEDETAAVPQDTAATPSTQQGGETALQQDGSSQLSETAVEQNAPVKEIELSSAQKEAVALELQTAEVPEIDIHIQFGYNSADVEQSSLSAVYKLAEALKHKSLAADSFLLVGHTDASGSDSYNLALSERRAKSVRKLLSETFGINPARLVAVGYGEKYLKTPYAPNAAINRRVQVVNIE